MTKSTSDDIGAEDIHVAIVMDGNGRWAKRKHLPRLAGHAQGAKVFKQIVRKCPEIGVKYLTVFAFSTENWSRSKTEVAGLMKLFGQYIKSESAELLENDVRVRFIGDRKVLSANLQREMGSLENLTRRCCGLALTVAINYGSRDELARAARSLANAVAAGQIDESEIDEDSLASRLDTAGLPDPDLVIRTSGEYRVSNFLLWQSAYSEFVFENKCWPDYSVEDFAACLARFGQRERRFGAAVG